MVRIVYYRKKCIGCNACVEEAPDRWAMSRRDGKSTLINGEAKKGIYQLLVEDHEYEKNKIAADNCPSKIIKVEKV